MDDLPAVFDRYGFAALVCGVLFLMIWKAMRFVGPLLTKVTDRHIAFVDHTEQIAERTADTMEELNRESKKTNKYLLDMFKLHKDPDSTFSTARTNEALLVVADIIELHHSAHGNSENSDKMEVKLDELRKVLRHG